MERRRFTREFTYIDPIRYLSWLFGKDLGPPTNTRFEQRYIIRRTSVVGAAIVVAFTFWDYLEPSLLFSSRISS
jgi:hypothetical protein